MSEWQLIDTAPTNGTVVHAKRVFEDRIVWEGEACWRTVHFPAVAPSMLDGFIPFGEACDATGWMYPPGQHEKRVPTPTHWRP